MNTRIEKDSMGELEVPADALYGAQTQRAINNFPVSGQHMPKGFIKALIYIKRAAARANLTLGLIDEGVSKAIVDACDALLAEDFTQHFPIDIYQTGSGTSTNMNANEVIAHLASKMSGLDIRPNDHVNYGQSSNDVIPTALHVSAAMAMENRLLPGLRYLADVIDRKADSVDGVIKTGRTHLMDAMPIRMSQELSGWSAQIRHNIQHLSALHKSLQSLAQGGTAVGTGINADPAFAAAFARQLSEDCGILFEPADNKFAALASQDTVVSVSGQLKTTAVSIMKIANDLRWMNSGPLAGIGEIELEALQPGSSIMPGKVNPVIPEAAVQVAVQVIGNDSAVTLGGQAGNFELNVMLPVIAHNLLESIELLAAISPLLADRAIATFKVREDNLKAALARNPILVTALNPIIGYMKAAEIAKKAYKEGRPIIDVAEESCDLSREELEQLLNPHKLTLGGVAR